MHFFSRICIGAIFLSDMSVTAMLAILQGKEFSQLEEKMA
jgi:hypothetical protein